MSEQSIDGSRPIRLRGHHLLCVFGFRGLGYDETFIANMAAVVRALRHPDARIEIVTGRDAICAACPRGTDRCVQTDGRRDQPVLAALGIAPGHIGTAVQMVHLVTERITPDVLASLCAGCSWYPLGVCTEGLLAGRLAAGWEDAAVGADAGIGRTSDGNDTHDSTGCTGLC